MQEQKTNDKNERYTTVPHPMRARGVLNNAPLHAPRQTITFRSARRIHMPTPWLPGAENACVFWYEGRKTGGARNFGRLRHWAACT